MIDKLKRKLWFIVCIEEKKVKKGIKLGYIILNFKYNKCEMWD